MPKETESQKRTIDRVMHEHKHGELKSGHGDMIPIPAPGAAALAADVRG